MNQYNDIETEQMIIGAILIEPQALTEALGIINSDEIFYSLKNRDIFKQICKIFHYGGDIDPITVADEYNKQHSENDYSRTELFQYLITCTNKVGSSAHVESHCLIIKEKYIRRKIIEISHKISEQSKDDSNDVFDVYEKALTDLDALNSEINRVQGKSFNETTFEVVAQLKQAANGKSYATGIKTGLIELDRVTGGLQPSDLIIVAARPAMGKTALALDTARKQAKELGKPVGFFSLEMSQAQLTQRVLSQETLIDFNKIRMGGLKGHEWAKLDELTPHIANLPIHVCDKGGLTINEICSIAKNWKAKYRIEIIYIDYLQIVSVTGLAKNSNREQEVSNIARRLKQLAKELNVPIVALAQLSRAVESRGDKRPMLSDLRESGSIEQEADIVIFPYRDGYYTDNQEDNSVELILAKHRNGKVGTVMARCDLSTQRFLNADSYEPDYTDYSQTNQAYEDDSPF